MKKVIKLLNGANHALGYNNDDATALTYIDKAIAELKNPRWETPEQYEKQTGEPWPDSGAVYCCGQSKEFAAEHGYTWFIMSHKEAKEYRFYKVRHIICATEAGPPPENWRPE